MEERCCFNFEISCSDLIKENDALLRLLHIKVGILRGGYAIMLRTGPLGQSLMRKRPSCRVIKVGMSFHLKKLPHHRLNVLTNIALKRPICIQFQHMSVFWLSSLTAMVSVVQSQMAKGTSRHLAMVWASRVLPLPVEPNIMMLDFSS